MAIKLESTATPWVRTREPLLWMTGYGHETRHDRSYLYDSRKRTDRPHVVLQLTLAGTGFYTNRRGRALLPRGKAFIDIIPGPFSYGYATESTGPYELLFLSTGGEAAERLFRQIVRQFGNVLDLGHASPTATLMFDIIRWAQQRTLGDRYTVSARLYELLMSIFSTQTRSRVAADSGLSSAIQMIHQRASSLDFTVSELADAIGCSREHLARRFAAAMGVSPSEYLTQHRLNRVARELRSGDDKLEAIARRCGFSGANYLCRAFRKRFGVTPADFRTRPGLAAW